MISVEIEGAVPNFVLQEQFINDGHLPLLFEHIEWSLDHSAPITVHW